MDNTVLLSDAIYRNFSARNTVRETFSANGVVASRLREAAYIEHWMQPDREFLQKTLKRLEAFDLHPIFDQALYEDDLTALLRLTTFTSGRDKRIPLMLEQLPDFKTPNDFITGFYANPARQGVYSAEKVFIYEGAVSHIPFLRVAIYKAGLMPAIIYYKHELENVWLIANEYLTFVDMKKVFSKIVDDQFKRFKVGLERNWPVEVEDMIEKSKDIFDIKFEANPEKIDKFNTPSFYIEVNQYQVNFAKHFKENKNDREYDIRFYITEKIVNSLVSVNFYTLPTEIKETIANRINLVFDNAIASASEAATETT